jgi:hypothetical protein
VNTLRDKDKYAFVDELQWLQREINLLREVYETHPEPSIENSIQLLKKSQDKIYGTLVKHGVTAEEVENIIKWKEIINSPDKKELIKQIEQEQRKTLQKSRRRDKSRELEPT